MRRKILKAVDLAIASVLPPVDRDANALVVLAFHSVLRDQAEAADTAIDPFQPLTLADVDSVATRLLARGYQFVTGQDIAKGDVSGPAAWLTFDDGYANNLRLVPLLRRLGVPATIFVASAHTDSGNSFWWDVLYRESLKAGVAPAEIFARREALKALPPHAIHAELTAQFGADAFRPVGELDRPMSAEELVRLTAEPLIEIGNHTHLHTILPVVDPKDQFTDIARCQERLTQITGKTPVAIAYPNGNHSDQSHIAAAKAGLSVGVTCAPCLTNLRDLQDQQNRLTIGRFAGFRHGRIDRELTLATSPYGLSRPRGARHLRKTG